ncbi:zinc finger protein 37 homolog [Armigeres subalbatus]|uniref:zinc finger protein 37 homolog n=1 Tax=Armigeres subalbatus TaxID=124917 RepID=UPI002ED2FB02
MSETDIDKICRLCCTKKGRLRHLFDDRQEYARPLPDIISDVSRLQVERNDGMPQRICRVCTTTLVKIYETIESYRANDLKLRQLLSAEPPVEIKEEEVDIEFLENAFTQDLQVGNVSIKQEVTEIEYLESEISQENLNESSDDKESKISTSNDNIKNDITNEDDYDAEWKPQSNHDKEVKKSSVKGSRKRRTTKDDKEKIPGRRRRKDEYPDRPRLHDHKCYICKSESQGTAEALLAHLNSNHLDLLPYTCPECVMETIVLKGIQGVNYHMRQHLNPVKCPYCDRRYCNKKSVEFHVQSHHMGENAPHPSPCDQCGKVYPSKLALKNHMRLHTSGAACEICGKVFKERNRLRKHIQRRHENLKLFECHICKKKLTSLCSVQSHIKTYHTNQVFKCSYCPRTYTSEMTHKFHEKKHAENPDYVATKDWKEYYDYVEGESEGGAKLKKCKLCGVVTRNMISHLTSIHFPSEFRCEICGATFKRKNTYDIHVLEHEHGKAVQCPICNREFSDRRLLLAHLRTKQHRDHPIAKSVLSTVRRTKNSKPKEANTDENPDAVFQDDGLVDVGEDGFV